MSTSAKRDLPDWARPAFTTLSPVPNKNFFLVVTGVEFWSHYLLRFFLPTLLGNIIGEFLWWPSSIMRGWWPVRKASAGLI
jgi:hypothetical protein